MKAAIISFLVKVAKKYLGTDWDAFEAHVSALIVWAEQNLSGKTGDEKASAIADKITAARKWKFPYSLFQRAVIKEIARPIVWVLNKIGNKAFEETNVDPAHIAAASRLPAAAIEGVLDIVKGSSEETIQARFNALVAEYGLDDEEKQEPVVSTPPPVVTTAYDPNANHFAHSEFTCPCGCGSNKTPDSLIRILNVIRHELGDMPIKVTSGTRCVSHNAAVGGATNSAHLRGTAADIRRSDRSITPKEMEAVVERLYSQGKIPELCGLSGNYPSIIHVDVDRKSADGSLRRW